MKISIIIVCILLIIKVCITIRNSDSVMELKERSYRIFNHNIRRVLSELSSKLDTNDYSIINGKVKCLLNDYELYGNVSVARVKDVILYWKIVRILYIIKGLEVIEVDNCFNKIQLEVRNLEI